MSRLPQDRATWRSQVRGLGIPHTLKQRHAARGAGQAETKLSTLEAREKRTTVARITDKSHSSKSDAYVVVLWKIPYRVEALTENADRT